MPRAETNESVALAFVNTRHPSQSGDVDDLDSSPDARRWLTSHKLLARDTQFTDADLKHLHDLRAAIRRLFEARIAGTSAKSADVTAVNEAMTRAGMCTILVWPKNKPVHTGRQMSAANPITRALAAIAADAIEIVAGECGASLIECDARNCVRLMIRDHGRRRWCSTRCGDRVRASRHYAKTRRTALIAR